MAEELIVLIHKLPEVLELLRLKLMARNLAAVPAVQQEILEVHHQI